MLPDALYALIILVIKECAGSSQSEAFTLVLINRVSIFFIIPYLIQDPIRLAHGSTLNANHVWHRLLVEHCKLVTTLFPAFVVGG
jgi:hypothetical protein